MSIETKPKRNISFGYLFKNLCSIVDGFLLTTINTIFVKKEVSNVEISIKKGHKPIMTSSIKKRCIPMLINILSKKDQFQC